MNAQIIQQDWSWTVTGNGITITGLHKSTAELVKGLVEQGLDEEAIMEQVIAEDRARTERVKAIREAQLKR